MPKPRVHWSAYLWPGLVQVWWRGSWGGLTLAVGFTALANVLLAATLVWDEWLPSRARWVGLAALGGIWIVAWLDARADWRRMLAEWQDGAPGDAAPDARSDQWFRDAQTAYLAGDWVAAEQTLLKLLRRDSRDAEARLMLATLWRHEGRTAAAIEQLDELDRLESAAPWAFEIAGERERIRSASVQTMSQEPTAAPEDTNKPPTNHQNTNDDSPLRNPASGAEIAPNHRRMAA